MAYLSRIWLNPLRAETRRCLSNPQCLHASILGGLSRQPVDERVLWRLETSNAHRLQVTVLTQSRPSWEHLVESAGWPGSDEEQALVRPYEPLLQQIVRGREFALRLQANPTMSTRAPQAPSPAQRERLSAQQRPRGVRVAHRTAEHQLNWFVDHAPRWGFDVIVARDMAAAKIVARSRLSFSKGKDVTGRVEAANRAGATRTVTLQTATFEALVRIDDPDMARQSILTGVGAGKAYGLGLITLAPPSAIHDR